MFLSSRAILLVDINIYTLQNYNFSSNYPQKGPFLTYYGAVKSRLPLRHEQSHEHQDHGGHHVQPLPP
jgi:hypothetical protein